MAAIEPEYFCELPRYHALTRHRKYLKSTQYEGRPDFFTGIKPGDSTPVPLRERKPCVIYPLPRGAVNQVVRFTFGESRFPQIGIEKIDADNAVAGESLTEEEAETLEKFVSELIERCFLKPGMRRVMRQGLAVGTACSLLSLKDGCIKLDVPNAEDVLVEFKDGDPSGPVLRAVWAYQYEDTVPNPQNQNKPESKRFWFRQDITDKEFVEYTRLEVKQGERPQWQISRVVPHNFGFCPVVWVRNLLEADTRTIDGVSLYEGQHEEFDALNFALSQRHRGINFWGVPQPWETGVEDTDGPRATGRRASGYSPSEGDKSPHGKAAREARAPAVKVSPDNKWSYRNENAKLGLLETTGKAFESATNHVNDIRSRVLEAMSVVLVNVAEIAGRTQQGQMSAKFLELAYEPLLALVDEMRHLWWPHGLQAILSMALRIVAATKGEGIYIPGAAKAAKILDRFFLKTAGGTIWMAPKMTPAWGDYFAAGPEEIGKAVETAAKAKDARLVPEKDAAKYVLGYFGREDTEDALEEIEEDKLAAQEQALQTAQNEALTLHAMAGKGGPPGGKSDDDELPPGGDKSSGGTGGGLKSDGDKQSSGAARRGKRKAAASGRGRAARPDPAAQEKGG